MNKSEHIRSLESIDLSSCTILDKNFSGVKFNGASFRGTRFDNVDFTGATFANCDFTECRMDAVSPYSTELSQIDMDDATQATRTDLEEGISLKGGMC